MANTSFSFHPPLRLSFGENFRLPSQPPYPISLSVEAGPTTGYTVVPGLGFSSPGALKVTASAPGSATIATGAWPVSDETRLSYTVFPVLGDPASLYASTYAALDLLFSDGTRLSDLGALDDNDVALNARAMGKSKVLYPNQWNLVECHVGLWAAGKTVTEITVEIVAAPDGNSVKSTSESATVWFDDVCLDSRSLPEPSTCLDLVDTRRGSNSTGRFSRGNTFPAVAVPNGFTLISPMTAWSRDWFYSWSANNTLDGRPMLEGVALSHAPSPWMGDRNQLVLAPVWGNKQSFSHDNEVARPNLWSVHLEDGAQVTITGSDHGAIMEFVGGSSVPLNLLVGSIEGECLVDVDKATGVISGWIDEGSGLSVGRSRMFFWATVSGAEIISASPGLTGGQRRIALSGASACVRVATSLISLDQARHCFDQEVADKSLAALSDATGSAWEERLRVLELPRATRDQLVSAYSSLYRVNLYPSSQTENLGTEENPHFVYASPALDQETATDSATGAQVVEGSLYVNHGFWDTYRTVWPFYALVYPRLAARLADGFLEFARTQGWMPRWSSPGYADLMTGTNSDVVFADLHAKGIAISDPRLAYLTGLKNATSPSPIPGAGRHDLHTIFTGFPDAHMPEGVSWFVESALNDAALADMADRLADQSQAQKPLDRRAVSRLRTEAHYLRRRSLAYRNGFNPTTGFFQGRDEHASFSDLTFDPENWGGDYTETNAWNYAFPAPHDGAGLAALYGGPQELAEKLDEYFATPECADKPGTYGQIIHEMTEARDVRMGQFGVSNQPAHHIPFMYHFAHRPNRASFVTREVVRRLFRGSKIGQGYPGDEDNGEMSAWYLFALTGLYPLQVGTPRYVLVAPATAEVVWHLPDGDLRVEAEVEPASQSPRIDAQFISSVTHDGRAHAASWLRHDDVAHGSTLKFVLTDRESDWAVSPSAAPPSLGLTELAPWRDLTQEAHLEARGISSDQAADLVNNDPTGDVHVSRGAILTFSLPESAHAEICTLTCTSDPSAAPVAWKVESSADGTVFHTVGSFSRETFDWAGQTRPFPLEDPKSPERFYRITFEEPGELSQVELLA